MDENQTTLQVRPAAIGDAEAVFRLLEDFVMSYQPQRDTFDRQFPKILASQDAYLPVAVVQGNVVGYALALRVPTFYANGDLWELQELMVHADWRSRGIGKQLLAAVINHARTENASEVVVPSRRAGGYYLKHGFTETAQYYKRKLTSAPEQ